MPATTAPASKTTDLSRGVFGYVWQHTWRQQLWVIAIILVSMPFLFMSLDLPKQIVNGPIQGKGFADAAGTATYFKFDVPFSGFFSGGPVPLFGGVQLDRMSALVALSCFFLLLVCINGGFKFYINTFKGRLGERMLRRLRFQLIDRVLRFPLPYFRKLRSAEVATMVKDEVEPLGGFIGDAFVQPVFLLGQALTTMIFIITQNFYLGMIAAGIIAIQTFIIPRLRKRLLVLGKQQQLTARDLAGRVGEVVEGIAEIRVNDTSNFERADVASRLGKIFGIRYELFQRKFFVKFLNNFLAQLTPFLFYLIGGYFAILGQLDIGQLVAVIAAYKDLPGPIKELIDWDQQRQDVEIKFTQVVEQFTPDHMVPSTLQRPVATAAAALLGPFEARGLTVTDETGAKLVEGVDMTIQPGERVAGVGEVNAGAETMAEVLVRLQAPSSGRVRFGDHAIDDLPEAATGRRIAYLGPDPYLRNTTLRDALLLGLMHHPAAAAPGADAGEARAGYLLEARLSGNIDLDVNADWLDYEAAGVTDAASLARRLTDVLALVELDDSVFELGLRSRLGPAALDALGPRLLAARTALGARLASKELAGLVVPFNAEGYNSEATVGENMLFGTALEPAFEGNALARQPHLVSVLAETKLDVELVAIGASIARTLAELFSDLQPDDNLYQELGLMKADELPVYQAILSRTAGKTFAQTNAADRAALLALALGYCEPRHRLNLMTPDIAAHVVRARQRLFSNPPAALTRGVAFYSADEFNAGSTLEDNILFGRVVYGIADGPRRVGEALRAVIRDLDLREAVLEAGLGFTVGSGGRRLSAAERQKIGLARALLKRPDLLVVNRGLSTLGVRSQQGIMERVLAEAAGSDGQPGFAVYWALSTPALAKAFDRVIVFHDGQVAEQGEPATLLARESRFKRLTS